MLFKDAPDLLDEFKDFLPEIMGSGAFPPTAGLIGILPQPNAPWNQQETPPEKTAAKGGSRRKKRGAEKEPVQKAAPTRVRRLDSSFSCWVLTFSRLPKKPSITTNLNHSRRLSPHNTSYLHHHLQCSNTTP